MGKTTRFHPVSLPIIRENARQCGFTLGRIHQDKISTDERTALYSVNIFVAPVPFGGISLDELTMKLNRCYSTDVQVLRCWKTRSDKIYAELVTTVDEALVEVFTYDWLKYSNQKHAELLAVLNTSAVEPDERDWLLEDLAGIDHIYREGQGRE
jgi:hypothetical protein